MLAAALGKALGGVVADRLGWISPSVIALIASAPLLASTAFGWHGVVVGMLLFQTTQAVTLVAVVRLFPKNPAFAFGLVCLALVLGTLPDFWRFTLLNNSYFVFGTVMLSAAALYAGLQLLLRERIS